MTVLYLQVSTGKMERKGKKSYLLIKMKLINTMREIYSQLIIHQIILFKLYVTKEILINGKHEVEWTLLCEKVFLIHFTKQRWKCLRGQTWLNTEHKVVSV